MVLLFGQVVLIITQLFCLYLIYRTFIIARSFSADAPFVEVSKKVSDKAIEVLDLKSGDKVADLGSGNGKVLFKIARKHKRIKLTGVELSKSLYIISRVKAFVMGFSNIAFIKQSILDVDLASFNKVYIYLTPELIEKIAPKLRDELSKGAVVVSAGFPLPLNIMGGKLDVYDKGGRLGKIYRWEK